MGMPTATVRLVGPDNRQHIQSAVGTGPVDAVYKAIDMVISRDATLSATRLLEFVVHAVTEGIDAIGEVTVRIESHAASQTMDAQSEISQPRTFGGYGADTDIVVASAKAYLSALNKVLVATGEFGPAEKTAAAVAIPAGALQ
jgi:2-isopropylmalate synthase